jgi:thymidine kinase
MNGVVQAYDVVGIDEGQFFPDLLHFVELWANLGKIVIVAALDGTFQRKPFGNVLSLVPLAESVTKLNSVCMMCYADAPFTRRLTSETEVEVIGGADKYIAVCRACFHTTPQAEDTTPGDEVWYVLS